MREVDCFSSQAFGDAPVVIQHCLTHFLCHKGENNTIDQFNTFMSNTLSKTVACIQTLDNIYSQSPTAQMLVSNAPAIIQGFNNIKALTLQQETELKTLAINRQYDLARFKEVSTGMMRNLDSIRSHIYSLQATVREYAHLANIDPNAKTVIDYTNRQIDQSISMFNNLAFQILNA